MRVWNEKTKKYEAEFTWDPEERRYVSSFPTKVVECGECRNAVDEHDIIGGLCDDCRVAEYEQRRDDWFANLHITIEVGKNNMDWDDEAHELGMWLEHIAHRIEGGETRGVGWAGTSWKIVWKGE